MNILNIQKRKKKIEIENKYINEFEEKKFQKEKKN